MLDFWYPQSGWWILKSPTKTIGEIAMGLKNFPISQLGFVHIDSVVPANSNSIAVWCRHDVGCLCDVCLDVHYPAMLGMEGIAHNDAAANICTAFVDHCIVFLLQHSIAENRTCSILLQRFARKLLSG